MSFNKVKSNVSHLGSSIKKHTESSAKTTGSAFENVKNNLGSRFHFKDDEDVIKHYQHDIQRTIKALKYLKKQSKSIAKHHWPRVFKINQAITNHFLELIGENSLQFDGIEKYYDQFDLIQAEAEIPMVHPKERETPISSVHHELCNYVSSLEQLSISIQNEATWHASSVGLRIDQMNNYLRDILKLTKKRNQKKDNYDKLHKKINKLMKKSAPLDEKEQAELKSLEKDLGDALKIYTKLDDKLKSILPHALSFLEEFVDSIVKIIVCKQLDIYKEIDSALRYFSVFHGFANLKSKDPKHHDLISTYEAIMDQWEATMTPTRIQLESFITIIHDKNPDLQDQDIDDEVKKSRWEKSMSKFNAKMNNKTHKLKPKDNESGLFDESLTADPIESFLQFQNPNYNRSETYHPTKILQADEVVVPTPYSPPPPPLPPRSNSSTIKALPKVPTSQVKTALPPLPSRPLNSSLPPTPKSTLSRTRSEDSFESIRSEESEASSISSDDATESTIGSTVLLENSSPDMVHRHITKVYNAAKNDIKECPIVVQDPAYSRIEPRANDLFQKTTSITYRLNQVTSFFDKLLAVSDSAGVKRRALIAKYDFKGCEPGDLSFAKGETVEVLFDFQLVDTLYSHDDKNWMVGYIPSETSPRMGFIPSNYF